MDDEEKGALFLILLSLGVWSAFILIVGGILFGVYRLAQMVM